MPHAIPAGTYVRRDAVTLTAYTCQVSDSPDWEAASAIPYDHPEQLDHLRREWEAGRVRALSFRHDGVIVGQVFFELRGECFVVRGGHALPAAVANKDFAEVMEFLEWEARRLGCKAIVTDTSRPGVLRDHVARGYRVTEVVLTKSL